METVRANLAKKAFWVIGGFGVGQIVRLASSVIMARLLAPEIFGVMVLVYSIRGGIDLLSDIGIGQSIVANKDADKREFFNTAWTLRLLRNSLLFALCILFAKPIARFYDTPILGWIMPMVGVSFLIVGFGSLGTMFLQRELRSAKLSGFELVLEIITSSSQVAFALFSQTIWAFIFGSLVHSTTRAIGNYIVVPKLRHRPFISWLFAKEIFTFGFWIFLSSLIFFLSANFDRLYLGRVIPLEILGIYGIARSLAEIANTLVSRLNFIIIFPFVASHAGMSRSLLRANIRTSRSLFLLFAAIGLAAIVVSSDVLITTLYDARYHDAGWMLSALTVGVWFSVICTINESTLLGFGKPHFAAVASGLKLAWLIVGVPISVAKFGFVGVVGVMLVSDVWRYIPLLIGQHRESFSFWRQDAIITLAFIALIVSGEAVRRYFGFGSSLSGLWELIH